MVGVALAAACRFAGEQLQFCAPSLFASYGLARVPPGLWYTDFFRSKVYFDEVYTAELLALAFFAVWARWMAIRGMKLE